MKLLKIFVVITVITLLSCKTFSVSQGFIIKRYNEETIILNWSYFQIWGNDLKFYARLTDTKNQLEPYEDDYYIILLNTQEVAETSYYNISDTDYYFIQNRHTNFTVITTPIKNIMKIGDSTNFNFSIYIEEEDLIIRDPGAYYLYGVDFPLDKGWNHFTFNVTIGKREDPYDIILIHQVANKEEVFNYSFRCGYGYWHIFDFRLHKNVSSNGDFKTIRLTNFMHKAYILPISGRIITEKSIDVSYGELFTSIPLNVCISVDKMVLTGGSNEAYVLNFNPLVIYLSTPFTIILALAIVVIYRIYIKWQKMVPS